MLSCQFKTGLLVVKPRLIPAGGVVALRTSLRKPFCKLVAMNVFVATFACQELLPPEGLHFLSATHAFCMAPVARHCRVRLRQLKARIFVRRDRKERRTEPRFTVAGFAGPFVSTQGKLPPMRVGVTVAAVFERFCVDLDKPISWLFALHVADGTGGIGVLPPERKTGFGVIESVRQLLFPTPFRVTRRTESMIGPAGKLPPVRVRVTVGTGLELCDAKTSLTCFLPGLPRGCMTFLARDLQMLPLQGIVRRRMIKTFPCCLPSAGRVAPVAGLLEFPIMRIPVAIRTLRKRQSFVLKFGLPIDDFRMAGLALHRFMSSG